MPKIGKKIIFICNKIQSGTNFEIDIFYNKELKFYAQIPVCFNENFDLLSHNELSSFGASIFYKSVSDSVRKTNNFKRIIRDESERGVLDKMQKFLEYLIEFTIISRNVIVVFFNTNKTQYNNMDLSKSTFPQTQMEFGLVYCTETSIPGGGKPKYMQYSEREWLNGEILKEKSEFHIWNKQCTVIDDTPENRDFLENIYINFTKLISAMKEFTKTPEALLQLISSGQKLLQ